MNDAAIVRFRDLKLGDKFSFGIESEWHVKLTSEHCQSQYGDVIEAEYEDRVNPRKAFYTYGTEKNIVPIKITAVRVKKHDIRKNEWIVEAYADSVTGKFRVRVVDADYSALNRQDAMKMACVMLGIDRREWKKFPIRKIVTASEALAAMGE